MTHRPKSKLKAKDVRGGMLVRVVARTDEFTQRKLFGRAGRVRAVVPDDCGASSGDPMLVVAFNGIGTDGFWLEELEAV